MAKKKDKKLKKKLKQGKGKLKPADVVSDDSAIQTLTQKIQKLKAELEERDDVIGRLQKRLKKAESKSGKKGKKEKKPKGGGGAARLLRAQQSTRIGIVQKEAWKQHGFLRNRYEYYMEDGRDKETARALADQDLRDAFGDKAGYTKLELEDILS
ncbi:MAG: hypothetical protein KME63_09990 [Candidatus Thiodiazotropha sp. (ex Clathrolucina costata)]|nr:hypothetical protein [Candidatus Thiodiazotropha taylori]